MGDRKESGAKPAAGRRRVIVERVLPSVEGGKFPVKRTVGERVDVEAHILIDGHDAISGRLLHRKAGEKEWCEEPLVLRWNDEWLASFRVTEMGRYEYTVEAWPDPYLGWSRDLVKRVNAGQDVSVELQIGANLLRAAARRAKGADRETLSRAAEELLDDDPIPARVRVATHNVLVELASRYPERDLRARYERVLEVVVDPERARFSSWYEMFPRSCSDDLERHGTFADVEARLPYVSRMEFDVLYLPPIHPIGETKRKGPNNVPMALPEDPGSPWAIGSKLGGHKAINPDLGTLEDFRRLVTKARGYGIDIALDIAFQCSPDHPYVKDHPEWFKMRPDGTVQYAENPPKKYEDIYPFDFETAAWWELWQELKSVFDHWIAQGVTAFRVDNPHTKPFAFWEWCITEIKREHPEAIFLAEAFTRPKMMYRLAALGFTQSYTYFAWRNTKRELEEYFTELTQTPAVEFFRPNPWPNTPDILTEFLQTGGRPAFAIRLVLASTLGANYGIYGPAFELCEHVPREPGSEEYLDSEKYQQRLWDLHREDTLAPFIGHVNRIRRENRALQANAGLRFHSVDNDQLIAYSKTDAERTNTVLVVVNLDPHNVQAGWLDLDLAALGLDENRAFIANDVLVNARYQWHGGRHFVQLDPAAAPAHIFRLESAATARPEGAARGPN